MDVPSGASRVLAFDAAGLATDLDRIGFDAPVCRPAEADGDEPSIAMP